MSCNLHYEEKYFIEKEIMIIKNTYIFIQKKIPKVHSFSVYINIE